MPIAINGSGTITGISTGGISDTKAVADAAMPTGSIIQVVSTNLTAPSSVSYSAAALSASTPVTVDVTSTVANSKFVIAGMVHGEAEIENYEVGFVIRRTIGGSGSSINVGTASGSRAVLTTIMGGTAIDAQQNNTSDATHFAPFLDSPNQAAGTTITYAYHPYGIVHGSTFYFCRTRDDNNNAYDERTASHITVFEVAP
mgnify:CR=1 FL=1